MITYQKTIISEYAAAPVTTQLIEQFNETIDPGANLDQFYSLIWNVLTAVGYGLDIWGRIVGVGRVLNVPGGGEYLGFAQASGLGINAFGFGVFYTGESLTSNFVLSDDAFRVLILAKALANICDGSITSINQVLLSLFPGRGDCYVTDGGDMTMTYTFAFPLTAVETAIVDQSGVLPTPVGVFATVVQV